MEVVVDSNTKIVWVTEHNVRYEWTRWRNKPSPVRILKKTGQWKNLPYYFKSKSAVKKWANIK